MSEGLKDKSPTPTIPQTSPTYSSPLPTSLPQPPQTAPPSIKIITPSSSYNDVSAVDPSNRNPFAKVFSPAELVESTGGTEGDNLMMVEQGRLQMALYQDEEDELPLVSRVIRKLANYDGGMVPNQDLVEQSEIHENNQQNMHGDMEEDKEEDKEAEEPAKKGRFSRFRRKGGKKKKKKPQQADKLGTILGVLFPCSQNIFGVLLFIRLVWLVGTAGWIECLIFVLICCFCTMTTSISMSAIATNGVVPGGGSYFMISRSLGPEFGGAVGILFYLGTSVASSMYIVGAVEILLQYIAPPEAAIFGPINIPANAYNAYRVYGTCLLLVMFTCVFIGVKFVSKFSPVALFCVVFSIICVYIGIFVANPDRGPKICFLGGRLVAQEKVMDEYGHIQCNKYSNNSLFTMYCPNITEYEFEDSTLESCVYFREHDTELKPGIPGLGSGKFMENAFSHYSELGDIIGTDIKGDRNRGDILADISTSFIVLIGIFFPSVTGLMAGSNRSGDLADAQKSIPIGTIGAVSLTSFVYVSTLLLFGATVEGQFLRDKIGESMGGGLIVAQLAWPSPWVIVIGSFLSTCGAGLQSLVGAPRLLQAIAADGVIPILNVFAVTNKKGEPKRALYLTAAIAECGVLLANVDHIAPIITMFFLMCYCFTNMACAVQTILKSPNWRPRFKLYHWCLSLFGVVLCMTLMFLTSWYYALAAIIVAAGIYKYIEYKGAEKEWGDGIRGLAMSAARFALLKLEEGPPHVKNWRPQLLILVKMGETMDQKYRKLLTFSSQLKAGRGLTLIGTVLEGKHKLRMHEADVSKHQITEVMKKEKVKGFAEVIVAKNIGDGLSFLIQDAGVGGLRHNTVLINWPVKWRHESSNYRTFIEMMKLTAERQLAVLIVKGISQFPENGDRMGGTIDVWWVVHEGGLLMLLPFLLTQGKVWKKCKLRIFTVAQIDDNNIQIQKDMEKFLYNLRIPAQVLVVEMPTNDISAYTYERTLIAEQRNALLEKMNVKRNSLTPQMIMDQAYLSSHFNQPNLPPSILKPSPLSKFVPIKEVQDEPGSVNMDSAMHQGRFTVTKDDHSHDNQGIATSATSVAPSTTTPTITTNDEDNKSVNSIARESRCKNGEDDGGGGSGAGGMRDDNGSVRDGEHGGDGDDEDMRRAPSTTLTTPTSPLSAGLGPMPNPKSQNVLRMQTAIRLNQVIKENSCEAKLVIVNLPGPPKDVSGERSYMDFLDVLTEGLDRVLMVRGGGKEVITIFS